MTPKFKILLTIGAIVSLVGLAQAQTSSNAPATMPPMPSIQQQADLLANIPTVPLAEESVGVSQGTLMHNDNTFSAATLVDWTFHTNFFVRGELDEAPGISAGIQGMGLGGGVCKSWTASRIWGVVEGRKDWNPNKWDAIVGAGVAYTPSTNGVLANLSVMGEERMVAQFKNAAPSSETIGGIRYSFP